MSVETRTLEKAARGAVPRSHGVRGTWSTLARYARNPLSLLGALIALTIALVALFAPLLAPHPGDAVAVHLERKLSPPSLAHPFGTDDMGRDIFSRVILGSRISVMVAVIVVPVAVVAGAIPGAVAGFYGDRADNLIMRVADVFLAFPPVVLALVVASALGPSLTNLMLAVSLTYWPKYARLVRAQTLAVRNEPYVEAVRAAGGTAGRIVVRHIVPNCLTPIIVRASMDVGFAVLTAALLSFIGVGAQPPTPEWGAMASAGRNYITTHWWLSTFPGLAIFVMVLGFNLLGDGLNELLNPRLRRFPG